MRSPPTTILVVDDDRAFARRLEEALASVLDGNVRIILAHKADEALAFIERLEHPAIVIAADPLGETTGVELLRHIHAREPSHQRILLTRPGARQREDATYPVVTSSFEKPTQLDAGQPLLRAIVNACRVPA